MTKFAALFTCALILGASVCSLGQTAKTPATPKTSTTKKTPATGATAAHKPPAAPSTAPKTEKEKQAYAFGLNLGRSLHRQGVDFDPGFLAAGYKDGSLGTKAQLTDDEAKAILTQLQQQVRNEQEAKLKELSAANKKEGETFLAANKTKEGVTTLPSGLQYKILKEGTGPKPTAGDTVVCNYRGTLLNGTEFDSSYKRNEPAKFPVTGVIKGWTEALQLMPVGSKWQLFIPSELAYGERGAGNDIAPNSTLIFEVELVSIEPKK
jgi:FKBP-type peptidyl-prolyl cis-trans isomerase FklB